MDDLINNNLIPPYIIRVGTPVENVRGICGDEVVGEMSSLWGLSPEGELQGCWKNTGVKGLYYLLGAYPPPPSRPQNLHP